MPAVPYSAALVQPTVMSNSAVPLPLFPPMPAMSHSAALVQPTVMPNPTVPLSPFSPMSAMSNSAALVQPTVMSNSAVPLSLFPPMPVMPHSAALVQPTVMPNSTVPLSPFSPMSVMPNSATLVQPIVISNPTVPLSLFSPIPAMPHSAASVQPTVMTNSTVPLSPPPSLISVIPHSTERYSRCINQRPRQNTIPRFPVFTPLLSHLCPKSTLSPHRWLSLLQRYPDPAFPQLLAGIAQYGARIGYNGPLLRVHARNHSSALRISPDINENIINEVTLGRVQPVQSLPSFYVISPLGAVPKTANGVQTGWRRIHDLSFPTGLSVNDGIPSSYASLFYQTIDDAIALIAKHGTGTILRKRDFKDAFRTIPVSPYDYWLLLFEWNNTLYVDIFLPFGLRTSPFLFNMFAEGFHWIMEHVFYRHLIHYLDDFLFMDEPDPEFFGIIATYLRFLKRLDKREDGTMVNFLGLLFDTNAMHVTLPDDKRMRALHAIQKLLQKGTVSHSTLEKLLGFLSFCARAIPLGRPFLRNLFNFLRQLRQIHPAATHRLPASAKRELHWWAALLPSCPGVRMIQPARPRIILFTDASGSKGIGGWWSHHAFSARVPRRFRSKLIDWKEAYAILFAFAKWTHLWHGHKVVVRCDNATIVSAINSRSIRSNAIDPIQLLFLTAAVDDIEIVAEWLSSEDNWIADALSRFNFDKIADLFPQFRKAENCRREPGYGMSLLLRRLQTSFGRASLPVLEQLTPLESKTTSPLPRSTITKHFQQHSKRSLNGSSKRVSKRRRLLSNVISQPYEATI